MATVVDLLAKFRADTSNFTAGVQKARTDMLAFEKSAYGGSGNIGKGFDHLNTKSVALGAAIGTAIGQIATQALMKAGQAAKSFIVDSVKGASDLNESTTKTEAIFGSTTETIMKFASGAATAIGQSKQQALDAAGTFGIYGRSAGLTGQALADFAMTQTALASDLASFYNKSPEEAIMALGAAFRGQTEPARAFGILMDDASMRAAAFKMGIISSTKEALTPQNKVLAANALILEKTKVAQGDFAKTSAGLANQQRILAAQLTNTKTQFGQALLPTVLSVVGAFNTQVLPTFTAMSDKFKSLVSTVTSQVAPVFANLKTVFSNLITAIGPTVSLIGGLLAVAFVTVVNVAKQFSSILKSITGFLANNQGIVMAVAAGFILLGGAIAGATIAFKIQQAMLKAYAVVQVLMNLGNLASIASTNALAASMLALNATLRANPIGAIVAVVALLVAGLIVAWKKSQTFRDVVANVFAAVANVVFIAVKVILTYMKTMINFWMTVAGAVLDGAAKMFGWIPGIGGKVKAAAKGFDGLKDGINSTFDKVIDGAEGMKNKVTNAVKIAAQAANKEGKTKKKKKKNGTIVDDPAVVDPVQAAADAAAKLKDLLAKRGEGAQKLQDMFASTLGQPNDLENAMSGAKATADSITSQYEKMVDAINTRLTDIKGAKKDALLGFVKNQTEKLLVLVKNREELTKKLEAQEKALEDIMSKQSDFSKSTTESLSSFASALADVSKSDAAAVVSVVKTATGFMLSQVTEGNSGIDKITKQLKDRLNSIKEFSKNIKTLLEKGVNKDYVKQLVNAGPEAAGAAVSMLASASTGQINEINGLYTEIGSVSEAFGSDMGTSFFGAGVDMAKELVAGTKSQIEAVNAQMQQLTDGIKTILDPLGDLGKNLGDKLTQGLLNSMEAKKLDLAKKAAELAAITAASMGVTPPPSGFSGGNPYNGSSGGGSTNNSTVLAKGSVAINLYGADVGSLDANALGDVMTRKLVDALNGRRSV